MNRKFGYSVPLCFTLFLAIWPVSCLAKPKAQPELYEAETIEKCLAGLSVEALAEQNPYYLRGDFDGDGMPDHAVAVWSRTLKKHGVVICGSKAGRQVLGPVRRNASKFSDMPGDQFLSSRWEVWTLAEVDSLRRTQSGFSAARRVEGIELLWEDGASLIYWDGQRFRWHSIE